MKNYKPKFHVGEKVCGRYRSATFNAKIVKIIKKGSKESTTEYAIKPTFRHISTTGNKESAIIHRYGDKLRKGWTKNGKKCY